MTRSFGRRLRAAFVLLACGLGVPALADIVVEYTGAPLKVQRNELPQRGIERITASFLFQGNRLPAQYDFDSSPIVIDPPLLRVRISDGVHEIDNDWAGLQLQFRFDGGRVSIATVSAELSPELGSTEDTRLRIDYSAASVEVSSESASGRGRRSFLAAAPGGNWTVRPATAADSAPAVAKARPGAECGAFATCVGGADDPFKRDGFALRLTPLNALAPDPEGNLAGMLRRAPPSEPPQPGKEQSADMAFLKNFLAGANRLAEQRDPTNPIAALRQGQREAAEGRLDAARGQLEAALARARTRNEPGLAAAALSDLGVIEATAGRYAPARQRLEEALQAFERLSDDTDSSTEGKTRRETEASMRRSGVDPRTTNLEESLARTRLGSAPIPGLENAAGVLRSLLNLANLAGQLGQYADADALLGRAQAAAARWPDATLGRMVLVERSVLYRRAGREADGAEALRQATAGAPMSAPLVRGLGVQLLALGRSAAPEASVAASAPAPAARGADAAFRRLLAQAQQREQAGDRAAAIEAHSRAALMAAVIGSPERERDAVAQLARLSEADGALAAAIVHGKRAVNLAQSLRTDVSQFERRARLAFIADKRRSYGALAALLMRQQRLAEAEHVLRLLKEDDGQQFLASAAPRGRVPYRADEAKWITKQAAMVDELRSICSRQSCGTLGIGLDDRREQEADLRARLDSIERLYAQDRPSARKDDAELAQARASAALPAARRSAADRQRLQDAALQRRFGLEALDDTLAALRGLQRQSRYFVEPLSAGDEARLRRLLGRVGDMRAETERATAFVADVPLPAESAASAAELAFARDLLTVGLGRSAQAWTGERRIDALDTERARLDGALKVTPERERDDPHAFTPAELATLDAGTQLMAALPPGTVALYYLPLETRLEVMLVGRAGRRAFSVPLPRAQLEQQIRDFRALLQNPRSDPLPAARALHAQLIAPLADALREAGASTLMLSLDGALRYLPFGALHDGSAWLAERYALDLYSSAAPAALTATPAPRWRVAAFGSSAGGQGLAPLPAVRAELEALVRDGTARPGGAMPGRLRLDRDFTAASLRAALKEQANVVHIASHFAFHPGDASASFLLLGDGSRLSLAELAGPDWRFDRVDLVTLSACETALAGDDAFGQEVEGLGNLLQGQGAGAVLATLWSVADASTAQFMQTLYTQREQRQLSRAQALRAAQLAMIRGPGGEVAGASRGEITGAARGAARPSADGPAADPAHRYAHPYYWAPFVLMGNWL